MMLTIDMYSMTSCDREVRECPAADFGSVMSELAEEADDTCRLWVTDDRGSVRGTFNFDAVEGRFVACVWHAKIPWLFDDVESPFDDDPVDVDDDGEVWV